MGIHSLSALVICTGVVRVAALLGPGQLTKNYCECRKWKKEYVRKKSVCGEGREYQLTEEGAPRLYKSDTDAAKQEICAKMYYKLDNNLCVNLATGKDNGTWCYTDVRCNKLNGGEQIPGQLPWKKCQTGRDPDPRLRDQSPEELADYAKHKNIWLGGLVRLAYPGSRADKADLVKLADFMNNTIPDDVTPKLKEFGNGDDPVWFDTNKNASVPIVIVHGKKAWKVDKALEQHKMHPGTWSELTCLVGCD